MNKKLNLGTLGDLRDGAVGKQFDRLLAGVLEDVADRPGNPAVRKLTIQVEVKPVGADEAKELGEKANIEVQMRATCPPFHIQGHEARLRKTFDKATGKQAYAAVVGADPDDADQSTFDDLSAG